jgi:hypothetical protein
VIQISSENNLLNEILKNTFTELENRDEFTEDLLKNLNETINSSIKNKKFKEDNLLKVLEGVKDENSES